MKHLFSYKQRGCHSIKLYDTNLRLNLLAHSSTVSSYNCDFSHVQIECFKLLVYTIFVAECAKCTQVLTQSIVWNLNSILRLFLFAILT